VWCSARAGWALGGPAEPAQLADNRLLVHAPNFAVKCVTLAGHRLHAEADPLARPVRLVALFLAGWIDSR
jgi:hypothetical protein